MFSVEQGEIEIGSRILDDKLVKQTLEGYICVFGVCMGRGSICDVWCL